MNLSNVLYLATFATVSAFLIHAVSSLPYSTLDDTIPYKRLFWLDKKSEFDDSTAYHVNAENVPLVVDCFLRDCIKGFTSCGKACLMTNDEFPCVEGCNRQRTTCTMRCFERYDMESSARVA